MTRDRSPLGTLAGSVARLRYAATEISAHAFDGHWWHQRVSGRVAGPMLGRIHGNDGVDFMARDWDNLLLLDACRADLFEEAIGTRQFEEYERVHSLGCSSYEWMTETFADRSFPDTVYVTANPWISKVAPDAFHEVVNLWIDQGKVSSEALQEADGVIDEAEGNSGTTIYADTLSDAARDVAERYPNKRLVVHYFQPHAPVVGNPDGTRKETIEPDLHPGDALREGLVSREAVWDGYLDNLRYVFTHASELADDLGGRTVFTADHGELMGEWLWPFPIRGYAHPTGLRHPKLTEVPWAVTEAGPRRRIVAGETTSHEADEDEIDDRLRDLGYKV